MLVIFGSSIVLAGYFLGAKGCDFLDSLLVDNDGIDFQRLTHALKLIDTQLQHLVLLTST